jgi:hypothetical protein
MLSAFYNDGSYKLKEISDEHWTLTPDSSLLHLTITSRSPKAIKSHVHLPIHHCQTLSTSLLQSYL